MTVSIWTQSLTSATRLLFIFTHFNFTWIFPAFDGLLLAPILGPHIYELSHNFLFTFFFTKLYTQVKFGDCIIEGCGNSLEKICPDRQTYINTWLKSSQNCLCGCSCCNRSLQEHSSSLWRTHTHWLTRWKQPYQPTNHGNNTKKLLVVPFNHKTICWYWHL